MSSTMVKSKKERLRECEKVLAAGVEEWFRVGMAMKEIKEDGLYEADDYEDFESYIEEHPEFGYSKKHAVDLMSLAELRAELPRREAPALTWSYAAVRQLRRLPGPDRRRTVSAKIVAQVEENGQKLTSTVVKKAVEAVIGKPKKRKSKAPTFKEFIRERTTQFTQIADAINALDDSFLKQFAREKSETTKDLATATDRLFKSLERLWAHLPE